jgi:hypothetical protein
MDDDVRLYNIDVRIGKKKRRTGARKRKEYPEFDPCPRAPETAYVVPGQRSEIREGSSRSPRLCLFFSLMLT